MRIRVLLGAGLLLATALGGPTVPGAGADDGADDAADGGARIGHDAPSTLYVDLHDAGSGHDLGLAPTVFPEHGRRLDDVVVTVRLPDLDGALAWRARTEESTCTGGGLELTCTWDTLEQGLDLGGFVPHVVGDATLGASGVAHFHATATGAPPVDWSTRVTLGSPDLRVRPVRPPRPLEAGTSFAVPVQVTNRGEVPARSLLVSFSSDGALHFDRTGGRSCHYVRDRPDGYGESAFCSFDRSLAPGRSVRLSLPLTVATDPTLLEGGVDVVADPGEAASWATYYFPDDFPVDGRGADTRVVPTRSTGRGVDLVHLDVVTTGHAELAAFGDRVRGRVGGSVRVLVGVRNNGPSDLALEDPGDGYSLRFTPPAGTTVTENPYPGEDDPWTCSPGRAGAARYDCTSYNSPLPAGRRQVFVFELRIDRRVPGARGEVVVQPVTGPSSPRDRDTADDAASVRVVARGQAPSTPPGAEAGGTPAGDDGSARWPWLLGGAALLVAAGAVSTRRFARSATGR